MGSSSYEPSTEKLQNYNIIVDSQHLTRLHASPPLLTGGVGWGRGASSVKVHTPHTQVFDNDISYIEGGTASGFYTVEDTHYVTR